MVIYRTSVSGGPNLAADAGSSGVGQSGPGAPQSVTGGSDAAAGQAEGTAATGNLTRGESSPANGGLARVLAGQAEAGEHGRGNGSDAAVNDQTVTPAQPKRNPEPDQSNDNLSLPSWAEQLPKKKYADQKVIGALSAFKSLDEFVQAYLDARAESGAGAVPLPGKDSGPEEVRAFYERLGKPKEAAGYRFAKDEPGLAQAAFEANLTAGQAEALYARSLAQAEALRKGIRAENARDIQAADAALQKEYGDRYDEALVFFGRGIGNNPKTGELSPTARALTQAGLVGKPEIVRAFIELGRALSESGAAGGRSAAGLPDSVMAGRGFSYKDSYDKE